MKMTIDEAIRDLIYLKNCGIFPFSYGTNGKQLTIATDECIAIAIDTMRKYQIFQLDYEARLKSDMVNMLEELDFRLSNYQGTDLLKQDIQEKINKLKGEEDE
jgi:hypothetical protein